MACAVKRERPGWNGPPGERRKNDTGVSFMKLPMQLCSFNFKFHYADFHRNFPAGKVVDTNHVEMFATKSATSSRLCRTLSQSWRNGIWAIRRKLKAIRNLKPLPSMVLAPGEMKKLNSTRNLQLKITPNTMDVTQPFLQKNRTGSMIWIVNKSLTMCSLRHSLQLQLFIKIF